MFKNLSTIVLIDLQPISKPPRSVFSTSSAILKSEFAHMSTPAQILANCRNAIRSTGPRSDAGKSTVSQNAAKHGLSAASPVLSSEDQGAFDALVENLNSEFQPHGEHEQFLVQQMAEARWRLARIRLIETAAFDLLLGSETPQTPYSRIAEAMVGKGGDLLSKLERYASAAERSYYKAHKELMVSAAPRRKQQAAVQSRQNDALLEMFLRPPVCKTKPIPAPIEDDDDEELELLTRPASPTQIR
jgi:hypothetical protein